VQPDTHTNPPTRPPPQRTCPVSHGDHLGEAAGFKHGGHHDDVGRCIDEVGQRLCVCVGGGWVVVDGVGGRVGGSCVGHRDGLVLLQSTCQT